MKLDGVSIRVIAWQAAQPLVAPLRTEVFVLEQGVPPELELDEFDVLAQHAVATDQSNRVVATGRLLPDGHIGRMAVARSHRGRGLGSAVLQNLMDEARRQGCKRTVLHAQLSAQGFYASHGFTAYGPVFMDAGIEHIAMERRLVAD